MTIAFTISSYRLAPFVQLGLAQLRKLSPDSPILVSDDKASESDAIKALADQYGAHYVCSRERRGHFANDAQSIVNALTFAEANNCDIAIKISQRFILRKPESIDVIQKVFSDSNMMAATPGKPTLMSGSRASKGFGAFGTLSDIVAIRTGAMTGDAFIQLYRARLMREKVPWASFLECLCDEMHSHVFPGRTAKVPELTNPNPQDPLYLRRYQATERQYRDLAMTHGFAAQFPLDEWNRLEPGAGYMCKPVVI